MGDHRFAFDFIVLDMSGFDLILGMDWLSSVRAHIDCYRRRVRLFSPEGLPFAFMVAESHQLVLFYMI